MPTVLHANFLYGEINTDIDVIMIGFADDEFNTKEHILLQKSLNNSDEETERGFDLVHITYCDESQSTYCQIDRIVFNKPHMVILLSQESAADLGVEVNDLITGTRMEN